MTIGRFGAAWLLAIAAWVLLLPGVAWAANGSNEVAVTGDVVKPLHLTVDDLRALPPEQSASAAMRRGPEDTGAPTTVRGVSLAALVKRAGLVEPDRHSWKHTVVLAVATDGYSVAYSWPELVNTDVGAGVLVVYERDGKALDASEGPIALVSAKDERTGPRHVRWLQRIEVTILKP
ncbi:MAG: molybdopterin-dependent oxidoreductase [Proteobacteria bacterium]|nr:molybdopterin-dependent oxidoreductase [Pseudomonadota bacterium]